MRGGRQSHSKLDNFSNTINNVSTIHLSFSNSEVKLEKLSVS